MGGLDPKKTKGGPAATSAKDEPSATKTTNTKYATKDTQDATKDTERATHKDVEMEEAGTGKEMEEDRVARLDAMEQKALRGFCVISLQQTALRFGEWNDRELNRSAVNDIVENMISKSMNNLMVKAAIPVITSKKILDFRQLVPATEVRPGKMKPVKVNGVLDAASGQHRVEAHKLMEKRVREGIARAEGRGKKSKGKGKAVRRKKADTASESEDPSEDMVEGDLTLAQWKQKEERLGFWLVKVYDLGT